MNMKTVNLNDRTTFYGSGELIEKLKAMPNYSEPVINFAYTDYGGTFLDRVLIEYFEEKHPDSIVSESTNWFGKNAFVFGPIAAEFIESTENYPLGFEGTEEYYSLKECEAEDKGFQSFLDDSKDKFTVAENALETLQNEKGGYFSVQSSGEIDFCWSDLEKWCIDQGIFTPIEAETE